MRRIWAALLLLTPIGLVGCSGGGGQSLGRTAPSVPFAGTAATFAPVGMTGATLIGTAGSPAHVSGLQSNDGSLLSSGLPGSATDSLGTPLLTSGEDFTLGQAPVDLGFIGGSVVTPATGSLPVIGTPPASGPIKALVVVTPGGGVSVLGGSGSGSGGGGNPVLGAGGVGIVPEPGSIAVLASLFVSGGALALLRRIRRRR